MSDTLTPEVEQQLREAEARARQRFYSHNRQPKDWEVERWLPEEIDWELCKEHIKGMLDEMQANIPGSAFERFRGFVESAFNLNCSERQQLIPFALRLLPYKTYLKTNHWKEKRAAQFEQAKGRCRVCNASGELHCHHRTYDNLGCEQPGDLIALCAECHELFHENRELKETE